MRKSTDEKDAVKLLHSIDGERKSWNNHRGTLILSIGILSLLLIIYGAGLLISENQIAPNFSEKNLKPSFRHLFGTDGLGRDIFYRTIKGLSISITIGLVASSVSAVIATIMGIAAATGSKAMDQLINWIIDLVMGIPHMILLILISFAAGRGIKGLLIGIAVTHWTHLARLVRSEVLQIRQAEYIQVSRRMGYSSWWILFHHLLPHLIPQIIIGMVLMFPHAILHESAISFLGYGLSPEEPAIGIILAESMKYITSGLWWNGIFPGGILAILVLLFDQLGENLKKLWDPFSAQD